MNIIVKKVRLVAPPEPPFVGTRFELEVAEDSLVWGFRSAIKSADSDAISVGWGDGTSNSFLADMSYHLHTFPRAGRYTVFVSDDISGIAFSSNSGEYSEKYAPMLRTFFSNSAKLTTLRMFPFSDAVNLTDFDIRETQIETIPVMSFRNCQSLTRVEFPHVTSVSGQTEANMPFRGCTSLQEIHFAEANKAALLASPAFQFDPEHLGAPLATVSFDL